MPCLDRFARLVAPLVLAAALAACGRADGPAPVVYGEGGTSPPGRAQLPQTATVVGGGSVTVQTGDTLYGIARKNSLPIRAIIDANHLPPPYTLQPGQRLDLPRVRTHPVQAGDTVNNIARRYGVSSSELVRANGISSPYAIQIGQSLILPGPVDAPSETRQAVASTSLAPSSAPASTRSPSGIETSTLPPPPSGSAPPSVPVAPAGILAPPEAAPPVVAAPPAPPPAAASPELPAANGAADSRPANVAAVPPRSSRAFAWPLRGRVISDYGPKPGGLQNDGVNIAAAQGTPFHAAENGVVVYAGNELRGFGNLILIRHADGWVTAYAHANEILVPRGEQVRRGQVIGRVGATGNVSSPQLHFEIRRGSRAVDPREFLARVETSGAG